jgi:phosphopentomutase
MTGWLGTRDTLADVAATLGEFFRLREKWPVGRALVDFRKVRGRVGKMGR